MCTSVIFANPSPQSSPLAARGEAEKAPRRCMDRPRVLCDEVASPFLRERVRVRVRFASLIQKGEHQFGFGDDGVVDHTMTFGFSQSFAARFRQLGMNKDGVSRQ